MTTTFRATLLAAALSAGLSLSAAAQAPTPPAAPAAPALPEPLPPPDLDAPGTAQATPADRFFASLSELCGQAFVGEVVADTPKPRDDPFAGQLLVMHVRECAADTLRIPFHVGEDRSRTWVVTRTGAGLRLKHDHRHEDGSADAVTLYGGDTAGAGTDTRQSFPVDADSVATFRREGLTASVANTWALELDPGKAFFYELSRPDGRLFRVRFDLTQPVLPPPAPWGATDPAR